LPRVEGADQKLSSVADHLLGTRARNFDVRLRVAVGDRERRQT
jgi:hypothetical protein